MTLVLCEFTKIVVVIDFGFIILVLSSSIVNERRSRIRSFYLKFFFFSFLPMVKTFQQKKDPFLVSVCRDRKDTDS